jgi:5-hydroxyisourate hydrolase
VISTHILDLVSGAPAAGVVVVLEAEQDGEWRELARTITDTDGRASAIGAPARGRARLRFATADYLGPEAFFDEVAVQFTVRDPQAALHVPLLLSRFGYSTYRGS